MNLSVAVQYVLETGKWFSKKVRVLKLFDDKIHVLNAKDQSVRFVSKYEELLGITKCLRYETTSFIVHFRNRADEEWNSRKREECVQAMADRFRTSEGRGIQIFGISSKDLGEYITSEKDILRKICKMPSPEFLIAG